MTVEDDRELKRILKTIKTVASVGVSSNDEKPSYWIFNYLMEHGYQMIPVNPTATEILGRKKIPVIVLNLHEDANIFRALSGEKIGTVIA